MFLLIPSFVILFLLQLFLFLPLILILQNLFLWSFAETVVVIFLYLKLQKTLIINNFGGPTGLRSGFLIHFFINFLKDLLHLILAHISFVEGKILIILTFLINYIFRIASKKNDLQEHKCNWLIFMLFMFFHDLMQDQNI